MSCHDACSANSRSLLLLLVIRFAVDHALVAALTIPRTPAYEKLVMSPTFGDEGRIKTESSLCSRRLAVNRLVQATTTAAYSAAGLLAMLPLLPPPPANAATATPKPAELTVSSGPAEIALRFDTNLLKQPPVRMGSSSEFNGVDNFYFPDFMAGTWDVTQTLTAVSAPLGSVYLGGPAGDGSIAEKTLAEVRSKLDQPVTFALRFIGTKWGVAEDRLFNTAQRLNAFAGRTVVAAVGYADVSGSNRASVLALGGTDQDPLQTTVVRFKGPAAQKTFVTGHGGGYLDGNTWVGYECLRSIFALTNENTAPPVTTDQEVLWKLTLIDDNHVSAQLRLVAYLNAQQDKLFFEARNRAVSIQDYTLNLSRRSAQ